MTFEDLDEWFEDINEALDWLGFKICEPYGQSETKTARYVA